MDASGGKNITDMLVGTRAPESSQLGASPVDAGGRTIAAAAHLLFPAFMLLATLLSMFAEASGSRIAAFFWLTLLSFLALVTLSRVAKPRFPAVSYHANQAHWWVLGMLPLLAIAAIPGAALTSATSSDAAGFVLFLPLAVAVVTPSIIAGHRVFKGEGHRYPFVAANLEAGKRWREE